MADRQMGQPAAEFLEGICPSVRLLVDISELATSLTPEQMASVVRYLFWWLHSQDTDLARDVLREIEVDWDERYGWLGGTDPD